MLPCAARAGDLYDAQRMLPGDIDMALAVEDAASWRDGALGPSLTSLVGAAAAGVELDQAWGRFASALGVPPERAFDGLLGRRVVYLQRGTRGERAPTWALISEVDEGFERTLTQKLDTAPRRLAAGRSAYGLENGRFWLAVVRREGKPVVLLGPADAPALFDEIWDGLGVGAAGGADQAPPVLGDLRRSEARPAAWLVARAVSREPERSGWFGLALRAEGQGLRAVMSLRSPGAEAAARAVRPTTRDAFDAASAGALLAIAEHVGGSGGAGQPWSMLSAASGWMPVVLPREQTNDLPRVFGPRAMVVFGSPPGAEPGGCTLTTALEASDVDAAARAGDTLVTRFITTMWSAFQAGDGVFDPETTDLGGAFPESVRTVDLSAAVGQLLAPLGQAAGGAMGVAWGSRYNECEPGEAAVLAAVADGAELGPRPGWWIVGADEAGVRRLGDAVSALPGRGAMQAWLSIGLARPAELAVKARALPVPVPLQMARALVVMELIEEARWELLRAPDGSIAGSATLRFAKPR
jgi:hypothetical protein